MTTEQLTLLIVSNVLSLTFGASAGAFGATNAVRQRQDKQDQRTGRLENKVGITEVGSLTGNGLIGTVKQHGEWLDELRTDG